ncbi:MAG TPA: hypothetical protein DF292_11300 [Firmicutes bacterium]|jgi:ABC-2 type transport system permease protein|nr:hypothetical protein [Bacillota bacterium]
MEDNRKIIMKLTNTMRRTGYLLSVTTRGILSYQEDFLIGALGVLLFHFTNLAAVYLVFDIAGPSLGWTPEQAVFLMAVSNLRFAIGGVFFWGLFQIPTLIRDGSFDRILLYPASPFYTLLCKGADPIGLIDIIFLTVALIWSASTFTALSLILVLQFVLLMIIGLVATFGFTLITISPSFWAVSGNALPDIFRLFWEFQPYPVKLFPAGIRCILTWIFPVAIAVSIPGSVFFGQMRFWGALLIVAGISALDLILGLLFFRLGLKKYQSVGN